MMRIYLASRSPRRRELLHQIGVDFETVLFLMRRDGRRSMKRRILQKIRRPMSSGSTRTKAEYGEAHHE
jgi:predicted house-cleaning NTP pyrophosphatase (Maf/HAM1 superfamily)